MSDDKPVPPHQAETIVADSGPSPSASDLMRPTHPDDFGALREIDDNCYTMGPELAHGGMGRIRYARDRRHGRPVAIKELTIDGSTARRRFEREALITARLSHPAIVPVYEAGTASDGRPFYAMKMVSGRSLAEVITETQRYEERLALLPNIIAVADAMAFAHSKRIVHRDLKPANVLIGKFGETVIIDWGLAKDLDDRADDDSLEKSTSLSENHGLTRIGTAMGTPQYMPPEQARGEPVDERADVYAIGATLYHALADIAPYADLPATSDPVALIERRPPTPLGEVEPRVPADLQTIVATAMAREPEDRYPTAQALAEELRQFQMGGLVDAYQYSRRELLGRWIGRNRGTLLAVLIVLVAGAVAAAWALRRETELLGHSEQVTEQATETRIALLTERGRTELTEGRPLTALAYLAEAYRIGGDGPTLRALLADATRPLDAIEATVEPRGTAVMAIDYSPDGARLAIATAIGVHVRDAESGDVLARLEQGSRANAAAFDPEGARLATASWDRPARVWDAESFEPVAALPEPVDAIAFGPRGDLLVTRKGKLAQVWDAATGELRARVEHGERVVSAALTADGALLVSAGYEGGVIVARARGGAVVTRFGEGVVAAAPSRDGARVATAHADGHIALWDTRTGKRIAHRRGHERRPTSAVFSRGGALLLTTSEDGTARSWDARDLAPVAVMRGHRARVTGASFSADDTRVVTTSRDWTAKVFNAQTGKLLLSLEHGAEVTAAAFAPGGMDVVAGGARGAKRWTLETGKLIARLRTEGTGLALAGFSPDGDRIATATRDGTANLYEATGAVLGKLAHDDAITALVFDADGKRLLTASRDGTAKLWESETGFEIASYGHDRPILAVQFQGDRVVSADDGGGVRVWDPVSGDRVRDADVSDEDLDAIAVSPDGAAVAVVAERASTAEVKPLDGGALPRTLAGHRDALTDVAFSRSGDRVVTASLDSTARIWSPATGDLVAVLSDHDAAVNVAAFSPTGDRVVTASDDGTAKLWDARTGALLATLDGHDRPVRYAAFDADGDRVITASADGRAILWDTHIETRSRREIVTLAAKHVPWRVVGTSLEPK